MNIKSRNIINFQTRENLKYENTHQN